jgi:hypothetical protein
MPDRLRRRANRGRSAFDPDRLRYEVGEDLERDDERTGVGTRGAGRTFGPGTETGRRTPSVPKEERDLDKG